MKTTYLVYKLVNGVQQLVTATPEEWDTILKGNRGLPAEQRRYFMKDCFADGDELDCMYISISTKNFSGFLGNHWHRSGKKVSCLSSPRCEGAIPLYWP